ncbi:MAG: hypothetical protein WCK18_05760 [Prolixibacteraceae bacterium]
MDQIPCHDYIDKIINLENHSCRMKNYDLLNPPDYDGNLDVIEIQTIAKILSRHIGYDKLIFTVSLKDFNKTHGTIHEVYSNNTAGNILLDENEDVLIHLSRDLEKYPDSILATLSHEISHKYIHFNKLTFNNSYENEVFTDLTSVFLGFGKLMLNGVEVTKKSTNGNAENTYTKKVGYLNREQLAFIYLTINYLNGVSRLSFYSQLRTDVIIAVKNIEEKYRVFFKNIKLYRQKSITINSLRYKIAYLEKLSRILRPINQNEISEYLKFEFEQLNLTETELRNFKKDFLTKVISEPNKSKKIRRDIPKIRFNSLEYNRLLKINRKLVDKKLKDSLNDTNLNIIECPICKSKLKTKNNSAGTIICPTCYFKFAADTSLNLDAVDFRFPKKRNSKESLSIKDGKKIYFFNNQYQKFRLLLLINRFYK